MTKIIKAANCCYPERFTYRVKYQVTLPSGTYDRKALVEVTKGQSVEEAVVNNHGEDEVVFMVFFKSIKLI